MKTQFNFVAGVWLGNFASEQDLTAYITSDRANHSDQRSKFARDIDFPAPFIPDLVEVSYLYPGQIFEELIEKHSYSGYFATKALNDIPGIPEKDFNSLLIVFGQISVTDVENDPLFTLSLKNNPDSPIVPVGKYEFQP